MELKLCSIIALVITLLGTILNSRKNIYGFYIWIVANIMWLVITLKLQDISISIQYIIFILLNFYGIYQWKKKN